MTHLLLSAFVLVLVAALSMGFYAYQVERQRRVVLSRADGRAGAAPARVLLDERAGLAAHVGRWLAALIPSAWLESEASAKLVQAGFEGGSAGAVYASARLGCALLAPALAYALAPGGELLPMFVAVGVVAGLLGPRVVLDRLVRRRRSRIRRALPDALDLLVSCVEAGVSLDGALRRLARDLAATAPDLAGEFLVVHQSVHAGMPREQALQGLWTRTGMEELRALASSIMQSKRWGTSITKVLRVYAESLRRARKESAETAAAEAGVKMLFPLMVFLLPALFVVILGPAGLRIAGALTQ